MDNVSPLAVYLGNDRHFYHPGKRKTGVCQPNLRNQYPVLKASERWSEPWAIQSCTSTTTVGFMFCYIFLWYMYINLPWSRCPQWRWSCQPGTLRPWSGPVSRFFLHQSLRPASPVQNENSPIKHSDSFGCFMTVNSVKQCTKHKWCHIIELWSFVVFFYNVILIWSLLPPGCWDK